MHECDYNPVIEFVDEPITLEDKLKKIAWNTNSYASYLEYDTKNKEFIKHVYAFKQTKKKWYCQEVYRESESGKASGKNYYYQSYGMANGMRTIWEDCGTYYLDYYEEKLEDYDKPDSYANRFYCIQLTTLEDIIANDLSLKYCKWNGEVDAFSYIKVYRKYPIAEMLMSLNLSDLALNEKCLKFMSENKSFCKYIHNYAKEIKDNHISFNALKNAFKTNANPKVYNLFQTFKSQVAKEISAKIGKENYKIIKKNIDLCKLSEYLESNDIDGSSYGDYINAVSYFKLDLCDTKILYPNDFEYWHDYYTNQMTALKNKSIDKKIAKQATKYKCLAQNINSMVLILPTKTQDFIDEGNALNHCVGRMKYNEKMAKGESLILFVRDEKEIEKPLYTLEFSPKTKSIRQFYGNHDTVPDEQARHIIYDEWLPLAKKLLSKKEKELCLV